MPIATALISLVASLTIIVTLFSLHIAGTGLRSPMSEPLGLYARTSWHRAYAVLTTACAVAGATCSLLLSRYGPGATLGVVLLGIFALASLIMPLFPMDAAGARTTARGITYRILDTLAFASATLGISHAATATSAAGQPGLAAISLGVGIVMTLGAVVLITSSFSGRVRPIAGITERIVWAALNLWFIVFAASVLL